MAIYWVDPHIGATVQANGTSDTVTRNGTYSAPWSLADVSSTSQTTVPTKMASLVSGDEVRFKGLPINTYTFELPNTTFRNGQALGSQYYEFRTTNATDAGLLTDYIGTGATIWPRVIYVSSIPGLAGSSGYIPINAISNGGSFLVFQGQTTWYPGHGYTCMGNNSFTARMVKYKEYGIDINTLISSTPWILPRLAQGVFVTSGWTSETVRDGVTLILCWSSASSTINWCYQSSTFAPTTGYFDCPELHIIHGAKGSNNTSGVIRVGSGGSGTTSTLGGITHSYSPGSQNSVIVTGGATLDIKYSYSCAYNLSLSSTNVGTGNFGTLFIRNSVAGYGVNLSASSTYINYKIGSLHGGNSNTSSPLINASSSTTAASAPTYEILANSVITVYAFNDRRVFNTVPAFITIGNNVSNTFSGRITNTGTFPGTGEYPSVMYSATALGLKSQPIGGSWTTSTGIITSVSNMNEGSYYVGELDTGGVDYKTVTSTTITDLTSSALASGISRTYVYQSNSYDGRPLMMLISGDHFPCLMYNDSAKGDALTWQQFTESAGKFFQKDLPVQLPTYTTQSINFQAVYSTSSNYNGSMVLELWLVNSTTGDLTLASSVTVSGANLTESQMNASILNSTLTTNNVKTAFLRTKLTSATTGGSKFWLHSITATLGS